MKQIRLILSLAFAFLVLFSSSSFTVGFHRCGGHILNIALFSKAEGCDMEQRIPPCHRLMSKPCCEDETIFHEGDDFKVSSTDITFSSPASDIDVPTVLLAEVVPSVLVSHLPYYNYYPPLRSDDLTVSYQVFLI